MLCEPTIILHHCGSQQEKITYKITILLEIHSLNTLKILKISCRDAFSAALERFLKVVQSLSTFHWIYLYAIARCKILRNN